MCTSLCVTVWPCRCLTALSADLSHLAEQRGQLAAQQATVAAALQGLQQRLPALEGAKRAAAEAKVGLPAACLPGLQQRALFRTSLSMSPLRACPSRFGILLSRTYERRLEAVGGLERVATN